MRTLSDDMLSFYCATDRVDNMEFLVDVVGHTGSICIECNKKLVRGTKAVRSLKKRNIGQYDGSYKQFDVTDCYYHVDCFCDVHKQVFKAMAVEICEALISK
jgi:hypothetical protein